MVFEQPRVYGLFEDPLHESIIEKAKLAAVDAALLREALEEYPEYFWPDPEGKPQVRFYNPTTGEEEVAFMMDAYTLPDLLREAILARIPQNPES